MSEGLVAEALEGRPTAVINFDVALDQAVASRDSEKINELLDPLAAAAGGGNAVAIELLLGAIDNHRLAHSGIRRLLLDPQQIEEASQMALIAVSRGIAGFEGRSRFTTWLHTVAYREAGHLLSGERKHDSDSLDEAVQITASSRRISSLVATQQSLEALINATLDRLPPEFRETLELREIHELSYQQIAERLDISVGTVKSRLNRARGECMRTIEKLGLDEVSG